MVNIFNKQHTGANMLYSFYLPPMDWSREELHQLFKEATNTVYMAQDKYAVNINMNVSTTNFIDYPAVQALLAQMAVQLGDDANLIDDIFAARFFQIGPGDCVEPHKGDMRNFTINFPIFGDFEGSCLEFYEQPEDISKDISIREQNVLLKAHPGLPVLERVRYSDPLAFNANQPHGVKNDTDSSRVVMSLYFAHANLQGDSYYNKIRDAFGID